MFSQSQSRAKAEVVHRQFLKQSLGFRKSTTNQIVLAELGRFPLQIHFWQQILHYHNRVNALPNSRFDKLALIEGQQPSLLFPQETDQ